MLQVRKNEISLRKCSGSSANLRTLEGRLVTRESARFYNNSESSSLSGVLTNVWLVWTCDANVLTLGRALCLFVELQYWSRSSVSARSNSRFWVVLLVALYHFLKQVIMLLVKHVTLPLKRMLIQHLLSNCTIRLTTKKTDVEHSSTTPFMISMIFAWLQPKIQQPEKR